MPDWIDRAQALEQAQNAAAVQRARQSQQSHPATASSGPRLCLACGDEIPPQRAGISSHIVRCIDCQTQKEARERT